VVQLKQTACSNLETQRSNLRNKIKSNHHHNRTQQSLINSSHTTNQPSPPPCTQQSLINSFHTTNPPTSIWKHPRSHFLTKWGLTSSSILEKKKWISLIFTFYITKRGYKLQLIQGGTNNGIKQVTWLTEHITCQGEGNKFSSWCMGTQKTNRHRVLQGFNIKCMTKNQIDKNKKGIS
jgi:hypothetical protein